MLTLVVMAIPTIVLDFTSFDNPYGCLVFARYRRIRVIISLTFVCSLLLIRTYALYQRNVKILIFLCLLFVLNGIQSVTTLPREGEIIPHLQGCIQLPPDMNVARLVGPWVGLIVFDISIFFLTLYKSIKEWDYIKHSSSVFMLVFGDGAVYFVMMALANAITVVMCYISSPVNKEFFSPVSTQIAVNLVSRLVLNIRKERDRTNPKAECDPSEGDSGSLELTTVMSFSRGSDIGLLALRSTETV
ncbi:hypothetical protein NLI96_g3129 [Meripilus lineatus]|uniref:Uncharacterized protein n=1 Tax=Meripilus lineatus TaxID=2056292 RepID=A0AAD5YJC2_9APHY|nr:hypothetical protein NLI96_g3129 [Physisporinus lineatus]